MNPVQELKVNLLRAIASLERQLADLIEAGGAPYADVSEMEQRIERLRAELPTR
jgi:hypothetical protein